MRENKNFQIAVAVSILAHSMIFLGLPVVPFLPSRRSLETLKITYYKIKEMPEKKEITRKRPKSMVKKLPKVTKEEILEPPVKNVRKTKSKTRRVTAIEEVKEKKFEAVIKEEQDDAKKATYISYYRAVREKIRKRADRNYPRNRSLGEGEVFLSFVVTSSGELLQIRVIDKASVDDALLRNIAIDSIRDASPFPPFPKGMGQYQITFNVIISFELSR